MQVSRWDRLKDMSGVLHAFTEHLDAMPDDTHLMLVGPAVDGVADDPEGAAVLAECTEQWQGLPRRAQERSHLVTLPMDDLDENAHLTNAIRHHATVLLQKSLVEGFGLTVTEALWRARPVIASAIGGITDQITDGVDGLLLPDPGISTPSPIPSPGCFTTTRKPVGWGKPVEPVPTTSSSPPRSSSLSGDDLAGNG